MSQTRTTTKKTSSFDTRVEALARKRNEDVGTTRESIARLAEDQGITSEQAYYLLVSRSRQGAKQFYVFIMQTDDEPRTWSSSDGDHKVVNAWGHVNGKPVKMTFWDDAVEQFTKLSTGKTFALSGRMTRDDYGTNIIQAITDVQTVSKEIDPIAPCIPLKSLFTDKRLHQREVVLRGTIIRTIPPTEDESGKTRNNGGLELMQDDDLEHIITAWLNKSVNTTADKLTVPDQILVAGRVSIDPDNFRDPTINARAIFRL